MSDSLFHFVFPFIAIMATGLKMKHKVTIAIVLAIVAVGLDADHFFGLDARATFHNVFVTLLVPLALFGIAMVYEKRGDFWKHFFLIGVLVMFSHPAVDLFVGSGGVALFYPVSDEKYLFDFIHVPVTMPDGVVGSVISSEGVGLTVFMLFIFAIIFVNRFIDFLKRDKSLSRAVRDTVRSEEKEIEKGL